jgi:hypothetical protein
MIPFGGDEHDLRDMKKKRLVQKMTFIPESSS